MVAKDVGRSAARQHERETGHPTGLVKTLDGSTLRECTVCDWPEDEAADG